MFTVYFFLLMCLIAVVAATTLYSKYEDESELRKGRNY